MNDLKFGLSGLRLLLATQLQSIVDHVEQVAGLNKHEKQVLII